MSYNLIYNCDYTQPIISTDSFIYSTDITTDQQNFFVGAVVYMLLFKMEILHLLFQIHQKLMKVNFVLFNILVIYNNHSQYLYQEVIDYLFIIV